MHEVGFGQDVLVKKKKSGLRFAFNKFFRLLALQQGEIPLFPYDMELPNAGNTLEANNIDFIHNY